MRMFGNLKRKNPVTGTNQHEKRERKGGKVQFNVLIEYELKMEIQRMATRCRVPVSCFAEHCFEVGLHYLAQTVEDEKKRKILDEHLERKHLLNEKTDDEEEIVRLSENNSNWLLLNATIAIYKKIRANTTGALRAGESGNEQAFNQYQSELFHEMVRFVDFVDKLYKNEERKL